MLLTLQNGVDIEERIAARYDRGIIIGGVAYIYSKIVEPGVIDHYKRGSPWPSANCRGRLRVGRVNGLFEIADLFQTGGYSLPGVGQYSPHEMGEDVLELRL